MLSLDDNMWYTICGKRGQEEHMEARDYLNILHVAERLKDTPRHCTTSKRRVESVAEYSWRVSLLALLKKWVWESIVGSTKSQLCCPDVREGRIQDCGWEWRRVYYGVWIMRIWYIWICYISDKGCDRYSWHLFWNIKRENIVLCVSLRHYENEKRDCSWRIIVGQLSRHFFNNF